MTPTYRRHPADEKAYALTVPFPLSGKVETIGRIPMVRGVTE